MNTIAERMGEALQIRQMKQSELVEKTGIGKSSISTYLSGEYEPKQRNIYKIAKALNVSEAWLMGYDVPMKRTEHQNIKQPESDISPELQELHKLLSQLDPIDRAEIRGMMKQMLRADKYSDKSNSKLA